MITVTRLTKRFGRFTAVDDLGFTVERGEAACLWGPNGAGKTTAIRCLLGLLPYRGRIEVAGHDVAADGKAARRAIGYVPQELALYDDFRLPEALAFFGRLKRAPRDRAASVLAEVGLAEHRRKRVRELSGGMKQRMALAVALLADPPVLVLDELTSNLDAGAQSGFMQLLQALRKQGKTILFTSHHVDEVEALADRVFVMEAGRLKLACGASDLASAIGVRLVLRIVVPETAFDDALRVLRSDGFSASPNGRSIQVEVSPGAKAAPIAALARARVDVSNFELAGGALTEGGIRVE